MAIGLTLLVIGQLQPIDLTASSKEKSAAGLPIQWLHIPKAGSTFGNSIYREACSGIAYNASPGCLFPIEGLTKTYPPSKYCSGGFVDDASIDGHHFVDESWRGYLVGYFRKPDSLKKSFLNYLVTIATNASFCPDQGTLSRSQMKETFEDFMTNLGWSATEAVKLHGYAKKSITSETARCSLMSAVLPRIQGGMSKMVAGLDYAFDLSSDDYLTYSGRKAIEKKLTTAVKDLATDFKFVGITDDWVNSTCAFRHYFSASPKLVEVEFVDSRPAEVELTWESESVSCGTFKTLVDDAYDDPMYAAAAKQFSKHVEWIKSSTKDRRESYYKCLNKYNSFSSTYNA